MSLKVIWINIFVILVFVACSDSKAKNEVVVYTSVDQVYSSEILKDFEEETGIKVKALYDTEASKGVGLEKRLLQERRVPKADIFWNSENLRSVRLDSYNLFVKRGSDSSLGIRSRVFIVNSNLLQKKDYPSKLEDIIDSKYKAKVAIANPLFGTTSAQFSALLSQWGEEKFIEFLQAIKKNKVTILSGNSNVKNAVARGEYLFGIVDSDDAEVGIKQGLPLKMLYYNQDKKGAFSVYETISIIKDSPNPKNAQKLFDYLLSVEVEKKLIDMDAVQYPILFKDKKNYTPLLWIPSAQKTAKYLQPSAELVREYLD